MAPAGSPASTAPAGASQSPLQIAASALGQPPANRQQAAPGQPAQPATPTLPPEVQAKLERLAQLEQQYQQLQPYAQLGLQQWQKQQQEQRAKLQQEQQEAAKRPWFELPKFDRSLMQFLRKNPETGQIEALPGAPPGLVAEYTKFADAFQQIQIDFFTDPAKYLAGPIERLAEQKARQLIEQTFGGYRDEVTANQIIDQHAGWMIERTPDGRQQLTPAGRVYEGYVRQAAQKGLRSSLDQHEYALALTQRDLALAQLRQVQQQPAAADAAKQQFVQQAAQAAQKPSGPATPPSNPQVEPAPAPTGARRSLRQMLAEKFDKHGITDKTLAAR